MNPYSSTNPSSKEIWDEEIYLLKKKVIKQLCPKKRIINEEDRTTNN